MTAPVDDSAAEFLWHRRRGLWLVAVLFFAVGVLATGRNLAPGRRGVVSAAETRPGTLK